MEREIQPGPFQFGIAVDGLKTGSGRELNTPALRMIVVAPWPETSDISIKRFELVGGPPALPSTDGQPGAQAANTSSNETGTNETSARLFLGRGSSPVAFEPKQPVSLGPLDHIVLSGVVKKGPATIVLRVDDRPSPAYGDRMNVERAVPVGPFHITHRASSLKTSSGRPLDLKQIHRLIAFSTDAASDVSISTFEIHRALPVKAAPGASARVRSDGKTLNLGTGRAPIRYQPGRSFSGSGKQLIIEGENKAANTQTLVIRLDDSQSHDYASRANIERDIPPGPFSLKFPVQGISSPRKRVLEADDLRLAIVSPWPETSDITISRFELTPIDTFPPGTFGFAFGQPDAPLPSGFKRIAPGDPRITGQHISPRRRPMPDPIIASGLRGIRQVRLQVPPGRKRVTIWSEDPGEWEHLPHALNRTIKVNGHILIATRLTPTQWLNQIYLGARWREHDQSSNAWTAFGKYRGAARSIVVESRGEIVIDIAGDTLDDQYLSAVLIEPHDSSVGLTQTINGREHWYRSNWRNAPDLASAYETNTARSGTVHSYVLRASAEGAAGSTTMLPPATGQLAAGTSVRLTLSITKVDGDDVRPRIAITPPRRASRPKSGSTSQSGSAVASNVRALKVRAWAGQWRMDRALPQDTQLSLRDDRLIGDLERLAVSSARPRRYELWVSAPTGAAHGHYSGLFTITVAGHTFRIPLALDVVDAKLPAARKPVGVYLGFAPHLSWFDETKRDARAQAVCDMRFLAELGLTGSAPAVSVPHKGGTAEFVTEMQDAATGGISAGWLIYNPLRQLRDAYGIDRAARFAAGATLDLHTLTLPAPVWSAADEPSNPDQDSSELRQWIATLRRTAKELPGVSRINLAGHLNSRNDAEFAHLFDTLIINPSFGYDRNHISRLSSNGRQVWFYNTFRPRLTAGVWLHTTKANRYIQWHARMPTASPLDPIDGREGDVQLFYPDNRICPPNPDIHRDLLRLAEGVVDQRWLLWLERQSSQAARRIATTVAVRIPAQWSKASQWTDKELSDLRASIMQLARSVD
jgi:hypothetical protein